MMVVLHHGTSPGSLTPFLHHALEREAALARGLQDQQEIFHACVAVLLPLLTRFDRDTVRVPDQHNCETLPQVDPNDASTAVASCMCQDVFRSVSGIT